MKFQIIKSRNFQIAILLLPVWYLIYHYLQPSTDWLVFSALGMTKGNSLAEAIWFFIFEFPKVILLLTLIIFFVGIVRTYFTPERTRKALEGKKTFTGNVMASMLGIVTPFCSCSAIPLFLGFVEAGIPLGVTFSFLIAAPMINEVAVVLLYGMFGWQTALIYVGTGLFIAILAGWVIGKLKLEKWIEPWVYETKVGKNSLDEEKIKFSNRIKFGYDAVKDIVGKVWLYVALGIAVGAGAHGYVPAEFMASFMGKDVWYAVPLSVLIGIPLYSNAAGIIPIVSVLIEKGASLGTALAFMMSVIGLSLPEMIILRKVLKLPLIFTFIGVVGIGIMIVGFLFNLIF
ncbi:MAG TPA: permease [Bacteroidales bacterium]|nr:permease [Bacteroidales bacterium]HPS17301.1 permease [Bacteroidales bacterium]